MMLAEDRATQEDAVAPTMFWCYLVSLAGQLFAVPDDERTVLLPFINMVPQVTPLPLGLVPQYVLGLVNVAQRGELLVDLARLMGLRDGPAAPGASEHRRMLVVGEGAPPENEEYRLAFVVDTGHELAQVAQGTPLEEHPLGVFVKEVLTTPRGEAILLNIEEICNTVLRDFGGERQWNEVIESVENGEDV